MNLKYDVIVIGNGVAGLTAGSHLARAHVKTLVLDPGALEDQAVGFGARVLGRANILRLDLSGPDKVVEVEDEGTFTAPAIILAADGLPPDTAHLEGLVDLNERGEIRTDDRNRTSVPGVFAAGDARMKAYRQTSTAASDGTLAALSAMGYVTDRARHPAIPSNRQRFLREPRRESV